MTNTARCPRVTSPALVTPGQMTRGGGGSQTRGHSDGKQPERIGIKAALGAAIPDQGALELN